MASTTWQIEQECPQCGGQVTLEESDHLLSCPFCRVKLYIASDGVFRYTLPPRREFPGELLLMPYWRFKGQVFSCVPYEVTTGVIDMTARAVDFPGLPPSLGVRPQAMKLRFATDKNPGEYIRPQLGEAEAVTNCEQTYNDINDLTVLDQAFLGETVSLVYLPIAVRDSIYDEAANRRLAPRPAEEIDVSGMIDQNGKFGVKFLPTLCPHCGWNLDVERDSLALLCNNCQSTWQAVGSRLERLEFGVLDADFEPDLYLPFWKTKPRVDGVSLATYADLIRFANLPTVVKSEWEKKELLLWTPAFKVHPRNFMRIAKTLTLAQPDDKMGDRLPKVDCHPVNLPPAESADATKILIAEFATPKRRFFPKLDEIKVDVGETKLVFVPFQTGTREVRNPQYRLCILRNLLEYGRNL